jgi:tetratricopeptide (TPR) repeat protein
MFWNSGGINFEDAYRFGQNALAISNKFGGEVWECRAAAAVYGCINIWKEPIQQCLHQSKKAYLLGLGSGDIEYSILNASLFVWNGFDSMPLDHLDSAMRNLYERMVVLKQEKSLVALKPVWQMCQNFMGRNDGNPKVLLGECLTQEDLNDTESIDCHFGLLNSLAMYEMLLAYHFSDFKRAETKLLAAERVYENMSTLGAAYARMYHALTLLATAKKSDWKRIRQVRRHLKVMRVWSLSCPENFLGKQLLVEAELAAVLKKRTEAYSKYYLAIIQSRDSGMIMQEALANERAGKFCASIGDKETARKYFNEALRLYKAWGGTAKYKHLEAEIRWTIMCFTCN